MLLKPVISFVILISLYACSNKVITGGIFGGLVGGTVGYIACSNKYTDKTKIAACVASITATSIVIGGTIGLYMDKSDQRKILAALQELPDNEQRHWTNEVTGNEFTIQPISTYKSNKSICRKYILWAKKKGSKQVDKQTNKHCE
ncbi:MAG: hypothetical protein KAH84_00775 [Thiomargarita sp.]|nr:hypothetical protein [Thiomargarita sp.]